MDHTNRILRSFLPLSFLLAHARFTLSSDTFLDTLFRPLHDLRIIDFYTRNHYWVDFMIFLAIFIPVARLTIGKRFGGRDGRTVSIVIGVVLALSLSLMERKMGFSIRSFGPIAATILIFLVALIVFSLVKTAGSSRITSGAIAMIVTYFLMRAAVPSFFLWLESNRWTAWLHAVLVVAIAVSFFKLIKRIRLESQVGSIGNSLGHLHSSSTDTPRNTEMEREEASLIRTRLQRFTRKGIKQSKDIIEELEEMIRIVDEYGDTDHGRKLIAQRINQIRPRENLILKQLAFLKDLSRKIESFDTRSFKELKTRLNRIPPKERDTVTQEILLEKRKILSEEKLRELETVLERYDNDFRYCLRMTTASLIAHRPVQAGDWLSKAIECEKRAIDAFNEMKRLEDRLLKLTQIEFKAFKSQEKA